MLRSLLPTSSQRLSVTDIVADDIERRSFGHLLSIPDGFHSSVELLVHESISHSVEEDISFGISDSPTVPALGGRGTLMVGAMSVYRALATNISTAISENDRLTFLVPHAYAIPSEADSLQGTFGGNVVTFNDGVYVKFRDTSFDPEIIRRAMASMIGCYSVAWLFDDGEALVHPVVAVVPIFDGDGFALVAPSRTSIRALLPSINLRAEEPR